MSRTYLLTYKSMALQGKSLETLPAKISLGLLITARKQHAEYRGNRNFGLSTTVNNRIMIFVIETKIPHKTQH